MPYQELAQACDAPLALGRELIGMMVERTGCRAEVGPLDVHFVNSLPLLEADMVLKPFIFKGSELAQDL